MYNPVNQPIAKGEKMKIEEIDQSQKLLEKIQIEKNKREKILEAGDRKQEPNLLNISTTVDEYFCLTKLQLYCEYLSYKQVVNPILIPYTEKEFKLLNNVLALVESIQFTNPLLQIYQSIRLFLEATELKQQQTAFDISVALTHSKLDQLTAKEIATVYSYYTNYCIQQINAGHKEYLPKLLRYQVEILHLQAIRNKLSKEGLPPAVFKNIVVTALNINDPEVFANLPIPANNEQVIPTKKVEPSIGWAKSFVDYYNQYLPKKVRNIYTLYCLAYINFQAKDFTTAYQQLQPLQGKRGIFINLLIKQLYLMCLFELDLRDDPIFHNDNVRIPKAIDAYKSQLKDENKRKKQLNYQKKYHQDFHDLFNRLNKFFLRYDGGYKDQHYDKSYNALKIDILKTKASYQKWLLEKLESIE